MFNCYFKEFNNVAKGVLFTLLISTSLLLVFLYNFSMEEIRSAMRAVQPAKPPVCIIQSDQFCYFGIDTNNTEGKEVYCEGPVSNMNCSDRFTSIMVTPCNGRLGNVMMAYATLYYFYRLGFRAILTEYQFNVMNYHFEPTFEVRKGIVRQHNMAGIGESIAEEDDAGDPQYNRFLRHKDNYRINKVLHVGVYPTPFNLFVEIWPDLVKQFQFNKEIMKSAEIAIEKSTEKVRNKFPNKDYMFIGIHNRREDYVWNNPHTIDVYADETVLIDFFHFAMNEYRTRYDTNTTKVVFLMIGNEPDWNEEKFKSVPDIAFPSNYQVIEEKMMPGRDMAIFMMCSHTIRTWGTFGLWGSLLSQGSCIYPTTHRVSRDERHIEVLLPVLKKLNWASHEPISIQRFFKNSTTRTTTTTTSTITTSTIAVSTVSSSASSSSSSAS